MRHSCKVLLPRRITSFTVTDYTGANDGTIFTQIYKTIRVYAQPTSTQIVKRKKKNSLKDSLIFPQILDS